MKVAIMNKFLMLLLLCFLALPTKAQKVMVEFKGKVHCFNDSVDILPNTQIIVSKGLDTIGVLYSDSKAEYSWSIELSSGDEITLTANRKFFKNQSIKFKVPSFPTEAKMDFALIEHLVCGLNSAIFDKNISDQFSEFDLDLMLHQLRKLSNYCIEFIHVTFENENDEIAQKRIQYFKAYFVKNNIDISNFKFKNENLKLDCSSEDCRGRIEGKMVSIGEKCK